MVPILVLAIFSVVSAFPDNDFTVEPVETTDSCLAPPSNCKKEGYRTITGECNNLEFPEWGAVTTPSRINYYLRLTFENKKEYNKFYQRTDGANKTSARVRSTKIFGEREHPSPIHSHLTMSYGQWIAHDVASSSQKGKGKVLSCCEGGKAIKNGNCAGINIPKCDRHFAAFNKTCQSVPRIQTNLDENCNSIRRPHQVNLVNTFLDLTIVYGRTDEDAQKLRSHEKGHLRTSRFDGNIYPPTNKKGCIKGAEICLETGDFRSNQNLGVGVLTTIYVRLHNSIAHNLADLNPHWDDEILYQEARKITIAIYQKILFHDYLPVALGSKADFFFNNKSPPIFKVWRVYNPRTHPGTLLEWNLCWRHLHTIAQNEFKLCNEPGQLRQGFLLKDYYNRPDPIIRHFDGMLCGLTSQPAKKDDLNVVDGLQNNLFKGHRPIGDDLIATDFTRNDEWLVDDYPTVYEDIWRRKIKSWEDITDIESERVKLLKNIYQETRNIDFYAGTAAEKKTERSLLGKTCTKIALEQFRRWIVADRWYYENKQFTEKQLQEISSMTTAKLFCRHSNLRKIQENPFHLPNRENNHVRECSDMGYMSFKPWKVDSKRDVENSVHTYEIEIV